MKYDTRTIQVALALSSYIAALVAADSKFNYDETSGDNYGPQDWDKVDCDELETCVSVAAVRCAPYFLFFWSEYFLVSEKEIHKLIFFQPYLFYRLPGGLA
jgi:hypothetical protein